MTFLRSLVLVFALLAALVAPATAQDQDVRIGVLAKRGAEQTLAQWQDTGTYLSEKIDGYRFVVVPLDFAEIGPAVKDGRIDFMLANSAIYVEFEMRYGVSRIATMRNSGGIDGHTQFGGVVFTRSDRGDIQTLDDVSGRRFAAVEANSLGGFLMAWRELAARGIDPYEDTVLSFSGTHDAVVEAVLAGSADAGTVRTDTLERMAAEGKIDLAQLKVIDPQSHDGFDYLVSTRLYPEWPFAKLPQTSQTLSHAVATALLEMPPECCAAEHGRILGWTVPRNYQPVHDLLRELKVGPYADLGKITLENLISQYWHWMLATVGVIAAMFATTLYVGGLNVRLRTAEAELVAARDGLAERVRERTAELEASRAELERISRDWNNAFDAIDDPIFIHDADMRIVQANPAYCRRAGAPLEELIGELYYHHFPKREGPLPACTSFPEKLQEEGDELTLNGNVYISRSFAIIRGDPSEMRAIHILEDVTAERQAKAQLTKRIALETLISNLAAGFVRVVSREGLDETLDAALDQLGGFAGVDRAYLFRYTAADDAISNAHEWCAPGVKSHRESLNRLPLTNFPWLKAQLMGGHNVSVDELAHLPAEADAERGEFKRQGVRSLLLVPLTHGEDFIGFVGFDHVTRLRVWSDADVRLLRTAAELITNTVCRIDAVEEVHKSEESLAAAQRIAHMGNWDWNILTGDLAWSDEIYRIFGLAPHQFGATYEAFLETVHPDDREYVIDSVNCAVAGETDYEIDHRIVLPDGEIRIVHEMGDILRDGEGQPLRMIGTVQDVTQARVSERELLRLNRSLATLSRCNTSLVHAQSEQGLLDVICRVLIESGGYRFAWIGFADNDAAKTIRPVAHAGHEEGFLDTLQASWGDGPEGELPPGFAIRDGQPFIERDIGASRAPATWREAALSRGFASVISFPLVSGDEVFGAITIDAAEPDAFDNREVALLQEMAGDLAFGISTLRARKELHQAEARYKELYENAPNAYLSVAAEDGTLLQFNQALCDILGYDRETLSRMKVFDLYAEGPNGIGTAKKVFARFMRGEEVRDQELQMRTSAGEPIWMSVSIDPVFDAAGNVVESRSMAIDISARKRAETDQLETQEHLQRALLQTIQAIALTIEKRDPYTAGHQDRVAQLAVAIAEEMELDPDRIEGLRLGALIHDIGKISVPVELLNRPGKLEPEMFALIKTHPAIGYDIVKEIEFPWPLADMVVQHHERLDGSGYPQGLKGDEILFEARILAVADVVEAMSSHRPYRAALGVEAAMEVIEKGKGEQFDAEVVESCARLYRDKPERWPLK